MRACTNVLAVFVKSNAWKTFKVARPRIEISRVPYDCLHLFHAWGLHWRFFGHHMLKPMVTLGHTLLHVFLLHLVGVFVLCLSPGRAHLTLDTSSPVHLVPIETPLVPFLCAPVLLRPVTSVVACARFTTITSFCNSVGAVTWMVSPGGR